MSNRPMALYLIGVPGSGKSSTMTAVRELLEVKLGEWRRLDPEENLLHVEPLLDGRREIGVSLGRRNKNSAFPGTDTLSLAVKPQALRWADRAATSPRLQPGLLLGEGQRLGDADFLGRVGVWANLHVAYIDAAPEVLQARREQRSQQTGIPIPGEGFLKGARTKADNVAAALEVSGLARVYYGDSGESTPEELANDLLDRLCGN